MNKNTISEPNKTDIRTAQKAYQFLEETYGLPEWRQPLSAVDELVSTILSQNTNDVNRDRAFKKLCETFPTWEEVRDADEIEVIAAIRIAGLANQKAPNIQKVLRQISEERGIITLEFLRDIERKDALLWLKSQKERQASRQKTLEN